jgi:hypothetical protein
LTNFFSLFTLIPSLKSELHGGFTKLLSGGCRLNQTFFRLRVNRFTLATVTSTFTYRNYTLISYFTYRKYTFNFLCSAINAFEMGRNLLIRKYVIKDDDKFLGILL